MSTPLAKYFGLKEQHRATLQLDPERDAAIFVDLDGVLESARVVMAEETPKAVWEGDFGTGKTHLLHHIRTELVGERFQPLFVALADFQRRSGFEMVYRAILEKLLPVLELVLTQHSRHAGDLLHQLHSDPSPDAALIGEALSPDVQIALGHLRTSIGVHAQPRQRARAWLRADSGMSASAARRAGYSGRLLDQTNTTGLVTLCRLLSWLHHELTQKRLLILLDEGESFSLTLDAAAQASLGAGLRSCFDPSNREFGVLLGLARPRARLGAHPLLRQDVRSRVSHYRRLLPLGTPERIMAFTEQLWTKLAADPQKLPFLMERQAQQLIADNLDTILALYEDEETLLASPTPRQLLKVLDRIGRAAASTDASAPLTAALLQDWFNLKAA